MAVGVRALRVSPVQCGRQRATVWPSCSKFSKCLEDIRSVWQVQRAHEDEPGCNVSSQIIVPASHVVLPSPEDVVSEVMRLRDLVS